jgi:hypothetical protein
VCYYPNSSPLFPVQGRLYVLAAVIIVGEDKLPRRRTSQASRVSDPLERGTWSLRGACGLDRIRPNRVYDVSVVQPAGTSTESNPNMNRPHRARTSTVDTLKSHIAVVHVFAQASAAGVRGYWLRAEVGGQHGRFCRVRCVCSGCDTSHVLNHWR